MTMKVKTNTPVPSIAHFKDLHPCIWYQMQKNESIYIMKMGDGQHLFVNAYLNTVWVLLDCNSRFYTEAVYESTCPGFSVKISN